MPYRFDEQSQKVVSDSLAANTNTNTKTDMKAQKAAKSSQGNLSPASGQSQSQSHSHLPNMDKSRQRSGTTLGTKMIQPDLRPILKKGFVIISLIVLILTLVIYGTSQQFKYSQQKDSGAAGESQSITLPAGKKVTPTVMHQFLMKLAARAQDEGNDQAAEHLFARAAEEARLAGSSMNKQYIDALFNQAELYQYSTSEPEKARPLFEQVLKAQTSDSSTKPLKLADTYHGLADSLRSENAPASKDRILTYYQKAIALCRKAQDHKGMALYCYTAGDYYFELGQYDKSLAQAKESLNQFGKVKEPDLVDLADSHYLAARSHSHLPGQAHVDAAHGEFKAALEAYDKADSGAESGHESEMHLNCLRDAAWNKLIINKRDEARDLFEKAAAHKGDDQKGQSSDSYMNDALR